MLGRRAYPLALEPRCSRSCRPTGSPPPPKTCREHLDVAADRSVLEALFEQQRLAVQRLLVLPGVELLEGAVGPELPGVDGIGELEFEDAPDLVAVALLAQREELLDPAIQVSLHQIGRSQIDLLFLPLAEDEGARVLQEAADERDHPDVLADAFEPGPHAADATDDEVYPHPCLGRPVERLDDPGIRQRV